MTAKIIDLGLAKTVDEPASESAISIAGGFCRDTGVCQSRAIRGSRRRHPFGSVLAWRDALGDGDWPSTIPGFLR